ncbi:MAG TPA: hypothetical protein P5234_08140 [Thermoanaerobaculaceae bacterium]|nr:hypothetical protein [Thermoanaerobaculaceae bacterium]HRS16208.1 hypothetical protein [Thermoanaerobaculaceae bacterium]
MIWMAAALAENIDPDLPLELIAVLARAQAMAGHHDDPERSLARLGAAAGRSSNPRVSIGLLVGRAFAARFPAEADRARPEG